MQKQQKDEQDKNQLQKSIEEDRLDDPDSPQRAACLNGNAQACAELANQYFNGTGEQSITVGLQDSRQWPAMAGMPMDAIC